MENIKIELEAVKRELSARNEVISDLKHNMNRISFVLGEWIDKYSFFEKPDPQVALEYTRNMATSTDKHEIQSFTWFWEYNRIHTLVDMALEYTARADDVLRVYEQDKQSI